MRALRLECDNAIVGGGLAGLVAAVRLPGKTILLSGGLGSTAVSSGVFGPLGPDAEAEAWLLKLMDGTGCRYVRGKCITSSLLIKKGLVQAYTLYEGSPRLISINEELTGFENIKFRKGRSQQEMARILDVDDSAIEELCGLLSGFKCDMAFLPPVLGIARTDEIRKEMADILGFEVREYVTAPSALGSRLLDALRKKAAENERLEMLDPVIIERIVDGHIEGSMGTKGKRDIHVHSDNLFIATGGPLTGFKVDGDRMFEPLTGATVSGDIISDLDNKFLSDHPLMSKGIGPELFIHGFDRVRVLGAAACGFGLYGALMSGYHAGDGL